MTDWRQVANVCSIIHVVLTSIVTVVILIFVVLLAGSTKFEFAPGFDQFNDTIRKILLIYCIFLLLVCLGQLVADSFMIMSTYPEAVARNRDDCECRVLAFLIYSFLNIFFHGGGGIYSSGNILMLAYGVIGLLLVCLCIPFYMDLRRPPQMFVYQAQSQMVNPNMYNPNPTATVVVGSYPQYQYPNQQQVVYLQPGGYPQQGGYTQLQQPNQGQAPNKPLGSPSQTAQQ